MQGIQGTELVVAALGRWNPGDLAYVESLEYKAQTTEGASEVILTAIFQRRDAVKDGWPSTKSPQYRVTIRFLAVRDFHIKQFGRAAVQIMGFDIIDISSKGWEDIRFSIEDYEDDRIALHCKEIEILNIAPI
jgi:hypothetical protein